MTDMTLVPTHWDSWDFDLSDGDRRLARVEMSSWRVKGRRDANVALPENWPLHIRVFVIWLALLPWNRAADSAGGA